MFLLFLSLIVRLIPDLKPLFSIYIISFVFVFVFCSPIFFWVFINPSQLVNFVCLFLIHNESYPHTNQNHITLCPYPGKRMLMLLSAHMFLFCFYPWSWILKVRLSSNSLINAFIFVVHIFHNLYWRIFLLFRQILITCLKCSRASFSPSYSEKRR